MESMQTILQEHDGFPKVLENLFSYLRYQKKALQKFDIVSLEMDDAFEELMIEMNDYLFTQIEAKSGFNKKKTKRVIPQLNQESPKTKRKKFEEEPLQSSDDHSDLYNNTETELAFNSEEDGRITLQVYEDMHENATVEMESSQDLELMQEEITDAIETYACLICSAEFDSTSNLRNHTKENHAECMIQGQFQCELCGVLFSDKVDLKKHEIDHSQQSFTKTNPSEYITNQSLLVNVTKDELDKYIQNLQPEDCYNGPEDTHPYYCKFCDSRCTTFPVLVQHLVEHSNAKLVKCSYCDLRYKTNKTLAIHVKSFHQKEKRFTCEICEKKFIVYGTLKEHMLLHTGEKPYTCDVCGESFNSRSQRSKHKRKKHVGTSSGNFNNEEGNGLLA